MTQERQWLRGMQINLGKKIKDLREQKGYSQQSFAAACGIDRTYLGQVERGEVNAGISILVEIAKKLEMTAADLFEGVG